MAQARSQQPAERLLQAPGEAGELLLGEVADFEVAANPLREAVSAYFCQVIDSGRITSYNVCYTKLLRGPACPA